MWADGSPDPVALFGVVAGFLAAVAAGVATGPTVAGLLAFGVVCGGLFRASAFAVTVGAVGLLGAAVLAAVAGAAVPVVLTAGGATMLCWEACRSAIERPTGVPARGAPLVHVGGVSVLVAATAGGLALAYRLSAGLTSPAALAALLAGGLLLIAAARA